jgi:hypothetical protein
MVAGNISFAEGKTILDCRLTRIFESSEFKVQEEAQSVTLNYFATGGWLYSLREPLLDIGLLKKGEAVKSLKITFDKASLEVHPSKNYIQTMNVGPTKLVAEIESNGITERREAPLYWAKFSSILVEKTAPRMFKREIVGNIEFDGPNTHNFPSIERTLDCK